MKHVFSLLSLLCLSAVTFSQSSFYVKKTGNDALAGTSIATAWKTIQKAMSTVPPGSTVHILAGSYVEKVVVNVNGTAGGRIIFKNYNSDVVKLVGTGAGQTMIEIVDKNFITIQGLQITNNQRNFAEGIRIEGNCDGIEIKDCKISAINFSNNPSAPASPTKNSNPLLVQGSSPTTGVRNLLISNCEVFSNRTGYSENITLVGNVDGFEISQCSVYNNKNIGIDLIGGYNDCPDPAKDFARNGVVKNCVCYNNRSAYATAAGIYVDGARNIVIENNRCYSGQWGIEVGAEEPGAVAQNIVVRNNLIYKNDDAGIACGGYNFPSTGKVVNCQFTGNTLFQNDAKTIGEAEIFLSYSENCQFRNNIVWSRRNEIVVHDGLASPAPPTLDYNCFWKTTGTAATAFFEINGVGHTGFANYQAATGQDLHSIFQNPQFVSTTVPDLHLAASSPCVEAGDPAFVPAATEKDMDGAARKVGTRVEIGADETAVAAQNFSENREQVLTSHGSVLVFPNPSDGRFFVKIDSQLAENQWQIRVFDAFGKMVFQKYAAGEAAEIDLAGQSQGIYFLEILGAGLPKIERLVLSEQ